MKASYWKKIYRDYLAAELPDYALWKSVLYKQPLGYLLRGVYLQPSGFSSATVSLEIFIHPLFTSQPLQVLDYTQSGGFIDMTGMSDEAIASEILSIFRKRVTPFFKNIDEKPTGANHIFSKYNIDTNHMTIVAYSYILTGQLIAAEKKLNEVIKLENKYLAQQRNMGISTDVTEKDLNDVIEMLKLLQNDPFAAVAKLNGYRENSLRGLGLIK
jgi:hypothetical protein